MKIVIIGDGKVGHKLTTQLSEENYDVVLIDQNEGKLKEAVNKLDIFCITGNGADVDVQRQADVPHADLVIACASTDELNMLSCLLAKRLGARHTIARVRNPIYYRQIDLLKEDLHLSMAVNPERTAANEIARVLLFPETSKVETFMKGRVELVEFIVREDSALAGLSLAEVYRKFQIKILVCAVKRGQKIYIPDGEFILEKGDKMHIVAAHQDLKSFFRALGHRNAKVKKVLICGGGHVCFYLAVQLQQAGMQVKIALTGMDEENIIMALFAKLQGVNKIVAKVNEDSRAQMVEGLGIDSIVSAKSATADAIMSYVRARNESASNVNVESVYQLLGGKVEALEFIIKCECSFTNVPLRELRTKKNNLIACIGRKRRIIIPNGEDHLEVGDSVVVVTMDHIDKFSDILE